MKQVKKRKDYIQKLLRLESVTNQNNPFEFVRLKCLEFVMFADGVPFYTVFFGLYPVEILSA